MNIYLIGMPGVGKTTLGKELADNLKFDFVDTDELIKNKTNSSISDLLKNEKDFRKIETEIIEEIKGISHTVVSLGGGSILNKKNIENFYGIIIYLYSELEIIKTRIDLSTRPLLEKRTLEKVYSERKTLYEKYCDYKIDNHDIDSSIEKISEIINRPKKKVLVINGPNMNMLGKREAQHYGSKTLDDINTMIKNYDVFEYEFFQSNIEGEIVSKIHQMDKFDYLIINPAAYTHTSIAIKDALDIFKKPIIEVHLSDVNSREKFRRINYIKDIVTAKFVKKKEFSYLDAINYLKKINL
ncbi:MAG: type II 3-dehydroquinate dehydratase [bacterium]